MKRINHKQGKIIMWILFAVGFLIAGIPLIINPNSQDFTCVYIGGAVMILGVIEGVIFVRCPHCGRGLSIRGGFYKFCPYCGRDMDKEN